MLCRFNNTKGQTYYNSSTQPRNTAEREKEAIDAANGGRKNRGEKERPYSDHKRITKEDIEKWKKENCECEE